MRFCTTRSRCIGILTSLLLAPLAAPTFADGFIYIPDISLLRQRPRPVPVRLNFPLEVRRHRVTAEVDETAARTRVEETFHNPNDTQLEGVYLFPLPPDAAISSFAMKIAGREVTGEVLEKGRAREIYEQIVRQTRDPGLLEYDDRGLFRASVFPIPARGDVEVAIEYSEALKRDHGAVTYHYPLDTGKYSSGNYSDVVVDLKIRSSVPIRSIQCPSHESAGISRSGEREVRVGFEAKSLRADRDFVVTWNVSEDALAPFLLTHRSSEPDGFFLLSLAPRADRPRVIPPKDIAFVIDTSGSMLGAKLEQTQRALRHCLLGLNAGDRFSLIEFSTEARRFREGLVEVNDESRRQALAHVDEMKARGGTNLEEGLRFALADLTAPERLQMVILLSDGEPTIGVISPPEILRMVKDRNPARRRVFVFGAGEDLNVKLLDGIARETGGLARYVHSSENIEVPISSFYDKIDAPILTDLRLEIPTGSLYDLYPRPLPDIFRGDQLDLFGRFQGEGSRTLVLRGKYQGEERVFEYALNFGSASNPHVPRLWATRKVGYLLEQMRLSGETKEVKDEVIRLAKLYGILTPYTSYLILEEDRLVQRSRGGLLPLFRHAAVDALRTANAAAPGVDGGLEERGVAARRAFDEYSGGASVEASKELGALKAGQSGQRVVTEFVDKSLNSGRELVRRIEDRAFYLQGSRWVDAALAGKSDSPAEVIRRIRYLSDEYFRLLGDEPGIGKILSLGPELTFLWKGTTYAIDS